MDNLGRVSRSEDLAVLRAQLKEAVKAALHIADEWGVCLDVRVEGGDEQGDEGPGLKAWLEGDIHATAC